LHNVPTKGNNTHPPISAVTFTGLFHRAIPASGSAINHWAVFPNQNRFNKNLASLLGAPENVIEDPAKRVQFLRAADAAKMTDIMFDVVDRGVSLFILSFNYFFLNPL